MIHRTVVRLLVLLTLLSAAYAWAGCSYVLSDDTLDQARAAIARRDVETVRTLVGRNPGLTEGNSGQLLLIAASCDPNIARILIDELGFDVTYTDSLGGVIYQVVSVAEPEPGCDEPAVFESLIVMLEAGADPCAVAKGDETQTPFRVAEEMGWSPELAELLRSHSQSCS